MQRLLQLQRLGAGDGAGILRRLALAWSFALGRHGVRCRFRPASSKPSPDFKFVDDRTHASAKGCLTSAAELASPVAGLEVPVHMHVLQKKRSVQPAVFGEGKQRQKHKGESSRAGVSICAIAWLMRSPKQRQGGGAAARRHRPPPALPLADPLLGGFARLAHQAGPPHLHRR